MAHRLAGQPFASGGAAEAATGIGHLFNSVFTWNLAGGNFTAHHNTGFRTGTRTLVRITTAGGASHQITGIAGGVDGDIVCIANELGGATTFSVVNESADSLAANRIRTASGASTVNVVVNGCMWLRYVGGTTNRWVPLASATE